jgi:hypothetical protein
MGDFPSHISVVLAAALTALLSVESVPRITAKLSPPFSRDGLTLTCTVEPRPEHRWLLMILDGQQYHSSGRALDGEFARKTWTLSARSLPCGQYFGECVVGGTNDRRWTARSAEAQVIKLGCD